MRRYLRALAIAFWRTLRGEPDRADALELWSQDARRQLREIERAAARAGIDAAGLRLRIDRRDTSMRLILATLRYHLAEEYPHLWRRFGHECLPVLRAGCLDDAWRLERLAAAPGLPHALREQLRALAHTLGRLPQEPAAGP